MSHRPSIESLSALTLAVTDMTESVRFYRSLGFDDLTYGGADAAFTTFAVGSGYLNLQQVDEPPDARPSDRGWGRAIFHVDDVDAVHARALAAGHRPQFSPRDASWGERYFHIRDPDGHELSFAKVI